MRSSPGSVAEVNGLGAGTSGHGVGRNNDSEASSPSLSVQVPPPRLRRRWRPPSPSLSIQVPTRGSSLDGARGDYDQSTFPEAHQPCRPGRYARLD